MARHYPHGSWGDLDNIQKIPRYADWKVVAHYLGAYTPYFMIPELRKAIDDYISGTCQSERQILIEDCRLLGDDYDYTLCAYLVTRLFNVSTETNPKAEERLLRLLDYGFHFGFLNTFTSI